MIQASAFGVISPFFPSEAAKKGVSTVVVGFIFGTYELVEFLASPIFGSIVCINLTVYNVTKQYPKYQYIPSILGWYIFSILDLYTPSILDWYIPIIIDWYIPNASAVTHLVHFEIFSCFFCSFKLKPL